MIVAGIGCRRGCAADAIVAVVREAEAAIGARVDVLAAPAFKRDEAGLRAAAALIDRPLHFIEDTAMVRAQTRVATRSPVALAATGIASVAEGAALAAFPNSRLLLPRIAAGAATCAIATCAIAASI